MLFIIFSHKIILICIVIFSHNVVLSHKVVLTHKAVPSQTVFMVSHKVVLSRKVVLSCQALCRSAQVVSQRTFWVVAASRNLGTSILDLVSVVWRSMPDPLNQLMVRFVNVSIDGKERKKKKRKGFSLGSFFFFFLFSIRLAFLTIDTPCSAGIALVLCSGSADMCSSTSTIYSVPFIYRAYFRCLDPSRSPSVPGLLGMWIGLYCRGEAACIQLDRKYRYCGR